MKFEATKDQFHDNIIYFTYDPIENDSALINFGDGQEQPIFPPRGQITHQYETPGKYKAVITQGKRVVGSVTVDVKAPE